MAILVTDVVGYSGLAGADEDGTLARLRARRAPATQALSTATQVCHLTNASSSASASKSAT